VAPERSDDWLRQADADPRHADRPVRDRIPELLPGAFPVGLDLFPYTRDELAARAGSPLLAEAMASPWRCRRAGRPAPVARAPGRQPPRYGRESTRRPSAAETEAPETTAVTFAGRRAAREGLAAQGDRLHDVLHRLGIGVGPAAATRPASRPG
jgi:hypothetical protein